MTEAEAIHTQAQQLEHLRQQLAALELQNAALKAELEAVGAGGISAQRSTQTKAPAMPALPYGVQAKDPYGGDTYTIYMAHHLHRYGKACAEAAINHHNQTAMTIMTIYDLVRGIAAKAMGVPADSIEASTPIKSPLHLMEINDEACMQLNINITNQEVNECKTVGDYVALATRKREAAS